MATNDDLIPRYDRWLDAPYQRQFDGEDNYDDTSELDQDEVRADLGLDEDE